MNGNLPSLRNVDVDGKKVLVIGAFDVDDADNPRANSIRAIVEYLKAEKASKIKVIGHCETDFDLAGQLSKEYADVEFDSSVRKDPREKENNEEYAKELASDFDVYTNEDFATSHRKYTSFAALPLYMKSRGKEVCAGMRFEKELEMLSTVWDHPGRRILVIGGTKVDDKQKFVEDMKDKFAVILKGGLLPGVDLRPDGLDITDEAINQYIKEIQTAEVILAAGVMGKYEDPACQKGTEMVLTAIANNTNAYKVAGGGDIEMAISSYGLTKKFNWISVGGGAMLVYLSTGTLPGIEALVA
jgi:3-phosphoglycerate kinase